MQPTFSFGTSSLTPLSVDCLATGDPRQRDVIEEESGVVSRPEPRVALLAQCK